MQVVRQGLHVLPTSDEHYHYLLHIQLNLANWNPQGKRKAVRVSGGLS